MTLGSHQQTIGKSQVHITPRFIIDALGPFDLDPCAADPRPWDCAAHSIAEAEDGLSQPWHGRVWMNPPFDRRVVGKWLGKMAEHGHGTVLVHARTETAWFRLIWQHANAVLFLDQRIVFHKPDGSQQTTAKGEVANSGAPVALCAFGINDAMRLAESGLGGAYVHGWRKMARAA